MKALFRMKDIDALPPYKEPDRTTPEAISLLKAVQAQMRRVAPGLLKSERVIAEPSPFMSDLRPADRSSSQFIPFLNPFFLLTLY